MDWWADKQEGRQTAKRPLHFGLQWQGRGKCSLGCAGEGSGLEGLSWPDAGAVRSGETVGRRAGQGY